MDFDDCMMGPPVQDLWLLASGDTEEARKAREDLIEGYEVFREFDRSTLSLAEPLRGMRIVYMSGWIARRWADPSFPTRSRTSGTCATGWRSTRPWWRSRKRSPDNRGGDSGEDPERPARAHQHGLSRNVCLVGSVLPNGFAQITPRGSTMVFDDDHIALWERGKGSTSANLKDGTKVTVFFRKPSLREAGVLPKGGIARFYGTAGSKAGPAYEEVWRRLVQPEKDRDPDKKGFAVLIRVERAEDLDGQPLPA